jgi:hypothetical protein
MLADTTVTVDLVKAVLVLGVVVLALAILGRIRR